MTEEQQIELVVDYFISKLDKVENVFYFKDKPLCKIEPIFMQFNEHQIKDVSPIAYKIVELS